MNVLAARNPEQYVSTSQDIVRKALWMLLVRVIIVTVLLAATILMNYKTGRLLDDPLQLFLISLVIAVYGATIPLAVMAKHPGHTRKLSIGTVAVDLLLAAGLVYATGTEESAFTFLFSLAIINSAIIAHRRGALLTAGSAIILLTLESILVRTSVLPELSGAVVTTRPLSSFISTLLVNSFAFVLVAYLASYLAEAKRQADETAERRLKDLTELEELHRCIVEGIDSGILAFDSKGSVTLVNPAAAKILGVPAHRLVGKRFNEIFPSLPALNPANVPKVSETVIEYESGEAGEKRYLEIAVNRLEQAPGGSKSSLVVVRDRTEIRAMQQTLIRSERLAALGELSASLAHELRNPLASMSGSIQLLKSDLDLEGEYKELMDIVLREADRLDGLVQDFLAFARPSPPLFQRLNLSQLLSDTVRFVKNAPKPTQDITIETEIPAGIEIDADPSQLTQVFLNLLNNAIEAVQPGGTIKVSVEAWEDLVRIEIKDDGRGLHGQDLSRVFEPFFTTKDSGTGLGLSIVHTIVDAHKGKVWLQDRPKGGCKAVVELPVHQAGKPDRAAVSEVET